MFPVYRRLLLFIRQNAQNQNVKIRIIVKIISADEKTLQNYIKRDILKAENWKRFQFQKDVGSPDENYLEERK